MDFKILLAFSFGMVILSATPGIGVLSSISTALSKGFKSSLLFITGLVIGDIFFFILAIIGMAAVSRIMGPLFFVIKIISGIYLIYIGLNILKHRKDEITFYNDNNSRYRTLLSGLLVTLGNPKPILFYASIVPTIIDINRLNPYEVMAIIFIISLISFIVIGAYCYAALISKSLLNRKKYQNRVNLISGITMISAGLYIILEKR